MMGDSGIAKVVHAIRESRLLRAGAWLSILNVLTGLLAYVFQLFMGKVLSSEDFLTFNAILALNMVICSPIGAPQAVASRYVAMVAATGGLGPARVLYRKWSAILWVASGLAAILFAIGANHAQSWFSFSDVTSVVLLGVLVLLNLLSLVNSTFLHGLQSFRWLGFIPFGAVMAKIACCLFFVVICSGGLHGALAGVAISTAIVFTAGVFVVGRFWLDVPATGGTDLPFPYGLVAPVVAASIGLTNMSQLDLLIVNRYFLPEAAGQYALAAVLGKAVLYLPGGLVVAILPIVAASHARSEDSSRDATQALWATAMLCIAAAGAYFVLGPALISWMYGNKYGEAGSLLAFYGLAMVPMAMAMVIQGFLVAKGAMAFSWVLVGLAGLEWAVMCYWHPSLYALIATLAAFNASLAIVGGFLMERECRKCA